MSQEPLLAFPQPCASDNAGGIWMSNEKGELYAGMTLRDYFAAKAMQGMISSETEDCHYELAIFPLMAERAYQIADAMLKERAK